MKIIKEIYLTAFTAVMSILFLVAGYTMPDTTTYEKFIIFIIIVLNLLAFMASSFILIEKSVNQD